MPAMIYRVDVSKLSWREILRISGAGVLAGAVVKLLGLRLYSAVPLTRLESSPPVPESEIPKDAREALAEPVLRLEARGLHLRHWFGGPEPPSGRGYGAATSNAEGTIVASALYLEVRVGKVPFRRLVLSFATLLASGRVLSTGSRRVSFDPPPGIEPVGLPGRLLEEILDRHRARLESAGAIEPVLPSGIEALRVRVNNSLVDSLVARGIATPMRSG